MLERDAADRTADGHPGEDGHGRPDGHRARRSPARWGSGTNILEASLFGVGDGPLTDAITATIEQADGFAQVFPEHKFHIVEVLQHRGHIVGMTGDGVNDAPALKQADAGIAVSGATDAARAAADIVLLTPGLSVIIDAIKESRKIFQRMTQLRDLPHRRDDPRAAVHDALDPRLQLLPGHGGDDRAAGAAQRRRHPVDRL